MAAELLPVQQTGSYSRCNKPGATPDYSRCHGCIAAAHRELLPVQQTGSYSRSFFSTSRNDKTASWLLTESYSQCNRPGATPDRSRTYKFHPGLGGGKTQARGRKGADTLALLGVSCPGLRESFNI